MLAYDQRQMFLWDDCWPLIGHASEQSDALHSLARHYCALSQIPSWTHPHDADVELPCGAVLD